MVNKRYKTKVLCCCTSPLQGWTVVKNFVLLGPLRLLLRTGLWLEKTSSEARNKTLRSRGAVAVTRSEGKITSQYTKESAVIL
ncbi:MAG: hypothetical protein ACI9XB_002976 [Gammaproteobacteria bacterium]|jgi:hypothetical protein